MKRNPVVSCFLQPAVLQLVRPAQPVSSLPQVVCSMTGVRVFVSGLARARKSYSEIQETVSGAYGTLALKRVAIYKIMKKVKAGEDTTDIHHLNP